MPFYKNKEGLYENKYSKELKFKYALDINLNKRVNILDFNIYNPENLDIILSEYKEIKDFNNIIYLYNHINGSSYKFKLDNENIKKFISIYFKNHNNYMLEIYKKIKCEDIIDKEIKIGGNNYYLYKYNKYKIKYNNLFNKIYNFI